MQSSAVQISVQFSDGLVYNQSSAPLAMTFSQEVAVKELMAKLTEKFCRFNPGAFSHCLVTINNQCVLDHELRIHDGDSVFVLGLISGG